MKPVMDAMGNFDISTVSMLSSITVFSMAVVSVIKQFISGNRPPLNKVIPLSLGSLAGGYLGEWLFQTATANISSGNKIKIIQNIVLCLLIIFVIIYMKFKDKIKGFHIQNPLASLSVGLFLGVCSSFLGVGGGPINVAVIILMFSFPVKSAAISSLFIILFAQSAKLLTATFTVGFSGIDFKVLPLMIVGAIAGGFIGSAFSKKLSEKAVEKSFNLIQFLVLGLTIFNIIYNLG